MSTPEKDELTGAPTTGHEWDGLKELNNPLPKWWLYVLYATIVFAVIYSFFVPPIPGVTGIFETTRQVLQEKLADARADQAHFMDDIARLPVSEIMADAELRSFADTGGGAAFAENCAPCHGPGGGGRPGYPTLVDDDWLWGGSLDAIQTTILHGVRNEDAESRWSEMPAFGRDGILNSSEIADVTQYVLSLSGHAEDRDAAERGATVFADNCVACHGENARGDQEQGAPNLADSIWLYGDDAEAIAHQIANPSHGVMPAWKDRLSDTTIKMLTVYVATHGITEE